MSAILKALKKLEQETPAYGGASLPGSIKGQGKRRAKSILVTGLILLPLCILIGAGFMLFVRKPSVPESPPLFLKEEKSVTAMKAPPKNTAQNRAVEVVTQKQEKVVDAAPDFEFSTTDIFLADNQSMKPKGGFVEVHTNQMPAASPDTVPIPDPIKTADPFSPIMPTPKKITPAAEDENTRPIEENAEPSVPLQPAIRISEAYVPASTDNTFSDEPVVIRKTEPPAVVIEDPAVELQAISWSVDADKRMAIINGRICREKDRVAGYVIQSINSGDVVISKGSVTGKLVFKIR